jgi:hypothetical protein
LETVCERYELIWNKAIHAPANLCAPKLCNRTIVHSNYGNATYKAVGNFDAVKSSLGSKFGYLDGRLLEAPFLNCPVGEYGEITGRFSSEELQFLAAVLSCGPYPVPVEATTP